MTKYNVYNRSAAFRRLASQPLKGGTTIVRCLLELSLLLGLTQLAGRDHFAFGRAVLRSRVSHFFLRPLYEGAQKEMRYLQKGLPSAAGYVGRVTQLRSS